MEPWIIATPFGFSFDLSLWQNIFLLPTTNFIKICFAIIGWPFLALFLVYMAAHLWLSYRREKHSRHWKWVLLAVDIPPMFIQTPKAVEQIFAHLSGARIQPNIGEKYWQGKKQKSFSFEIVSIDGYIQFLIRTEEGFRDLVEAAIYAQYTEAEITEVEDYVGNIPAHFPDSENDVFGVEFGLEEDDAYPIRTYPSFEYNISKDAVFSDPMAALLENFSRISYGENFWLQLIVEPTDNHWKEKGIKLVKKLLTGNDDGHHGGGAASGISKIMGASTSLLSDFSNVFNGVEADKHAKKGHDGHDVKIEKKISDLTPGAKNTMEAVEEKILKIGFKSKLRVLYAAKKSVYNPARCISGFIGAINQFHIIGRNALVPHEVTEAHYAFKNRKENHLKSHFVHAFQKRKLKTGGTPYILNIEELATLWHFPLPFVKTPLLQKAGAKRAEPPAGLPFDMPEGWPTKKGMPHSAQPHHKHTGLFSVSETEEEVPTDLPME